MAPSPPQAAAGRGGWLGSLLYLPALMAAGWLLARPLAVLAPGLRPDQVDLAGTVVALLLLLASLPTWLRRQWHEPHPWVRLGVAAPLGPLARAMLRGLLKALLLLALVVTGLALAGQVRAGPGISIGQLANGLALLLGVGFAEELIFRGWLWGELARWIGNGRALMAQALVFSLVHPWPLEHGLLALLALKGGLLLLGVALALQRRANRGLLWGAVGLHGGLVGGWFLLQGGMVTINTAAPVWLIGPANPIGGLLGWLGLGLLLLARRRWWSCCSTAPHEQQ
ncbi:MAG: CPBP family intramembrane glutamic endopeptidase [Synechococcaceae cyanobacterium ELA445]